MAATGMDFVSDAGWSQMSFQTSLSGLATPWATALAVSMTLPPPRPRTMSAPKAAALAMASRAKDTRGFGWTPPRDSQAMPASWSCRQIRSSRPERTALPPP